MLLYIIFGGKGTARKECDLICYSVPNSNGASRIQIVYGNSLDLITTLERSGVIDIFLLTILGQTSSECEEDYWILPDWKMKCITQFIQNGPLDIHRNEIKLPSQHKKLMNEIINHNKNIILEIRNDIFPASAFSEKRI